MKITKIEEQKKRGERVSIFLDEKFAFGLDSKLLVDFDLYKGKELTETEITRIKEGESLSKCLDKAYRFLSYRPRSEKEMRDKLLEKFPTAMVEEAIKRLKKFNLVNDTEFARAWINSRSTGRGSRALSFELQRKGVAKGIIEEALTDLDQDQEYQAAVAQVQKKSKYQNLSKDEAYKKIAPFLSRRGYSYEVIKKVIEEVSSAN
jgi:regulatory protein